MNYLKITLPSKILLYSEIENDNIFQIIEFDSSHWKVKCKGSSYSINWNKLSCSHDLKIILKLFIDFRFKNNSISTVVGNDFRFLKKIKLKDAKELKNEEIILSSYISIKDYAIQLTFKKFYEWGFKMGISFFKLSIIKSLREIKLDHKTPYEKIFLQQDFISEIEIDKIRSFIKLIPRDNLSFTELRNNIILQLSYELAPRPSQFWLLNQTDFNFAEGKNTRYYSLNLPMSKKIKSYDVEKRKRSISKELGEKFLKYIKICKSKKKPMPMFINKDGDRLSSKDFTKIVKLELEKIGVYRTPTDLRHNLAQSLADQGASAEIIAEILGHNSTVPARAYIASTPKIADIKANALGKNNKYKKIMKMLTGDFKDENEVTNKRKIKGMVGSQYIGGIGKCGLPEDTTCPKNPIYSCYSCIKFHPFKNKSQHINVKEELQKQAQYFLDITEKGNDIEYNRSVTQLEKTITAVQRVIDLIDLKNERTR